MAERDNVSFLMDCGMHPEEIGKIEDLEGAVRDILKQGKDPGTMRTEADIYERLSDEGPEDKSRFSWDDRGMSRLFAVVFSDKHRWNSTAKDWYFYDGSRWKPDYGGMEALKSAKIFSDVLIRYALDIGKLSGQSNNLFLSFVAKYGQLRHRKTLIEDCRSETYFTHEQLDANTNLFNCLNGTLDMETGEFRDHRAEDLLSKISGVVYDPEASSPLFEQFLDEVMMGDSEKVDYIQRIIGYSLTADTSLETCWILYGSTTRNGKSTLVETISAMLGGAEGYALSMPPETLAQRKNKDTRNASGDIARLNGCRFLNASEPPKRMLFDTALLKTLLGRDSIAARHLFEREFQFMPSFKLFINTNFLPLISDETLFTSGRINVIEFPRHFEPHEQDRDLKRKLTTPENLSGIFNWAIKGLRKYLESGAVPPASVMAATDAYRQSSDKVGQFLLDCMEQTGKNTGAGAAYQRYVTWCSENGFGCENKGNFFAELKAKGIYADSGTVNGVTVRRIIRGYELIQDGPQLPEPPSYFPKWEEVPPEFTDSL